MVTDDSSYHHHITHIFAAPAVLKLWLSRRRNKVLAQLKMFVMGGDSYDEHLLVLSKVVAPQAQIAYFYGSAELSFIAFKQLVDGDLPHQVGYLFTGVEVRFDSEQIWVKSPQAFMGYIEQGNLIKSDKWLPSGDVGYMDKNGQLCLKGRIQREFLINAIIVNPEVIERCLKGLDSIKQCVVFKAQNDKGYDEIWAVVVLHDEHQRIDKKSLQQVCQQRLPFAQLPKHFFVASSLPITHSGKIDLAHIDQYALCVQNSVKL